MELRWEEALTKEVGRLSRRMEGTEALNEASRIMVDFTGESIKSAEDSSCRS